MLTSIRILHLLFVAVLHTSCFMMISGCDSAAPLEQRQKQNDVSEVAGDVDLVVENNVLIEGLEIPETNAGSTHTDVGNSIPVLTDIHESLGIRFVYDNGHSSVRRMNESIGGGVGWVDYDLDGQLDLYCVQGGPSDAVERDSNPADELFRRYGAQFFGVADVAGVADRKFSDGIAVADFDGDGFHDLYVTNVGRDTFYHNQGDGTFSDITLQSGAVNHLWAASAAWSDLNGDGLLDLYVCNYLDYDPANPQACFNEEGQPRICHPDNVGPLPNRLFISNGDGTFDERLKPSGLDVDDSKSLGVVIADFNQDFTPDIFVANDTTYNHLFLNDGTGVFRENGVAAGCAVSGRGQFQASMGVAFGDYNRDGLWDLYLTHFTSDSNTLYRGLPGGGFLDVTREESLHDPTLAFLAFGAVCIDLDCNGSDELFVANGHVDKMDKDAWKMPAQLFGYNGKSWDEYTSKAGDYFQKEYLGRGVAVGDFDRDGYPELAVINQGDEACILRTESRAGNWLNVSFLSDSLNRHGIGCVVTLTQDGEKIVQTLAGGTSYCASHEQKLFFGLGQNQGDCQVHVRWPNGREQVIEHVGVNQHLVVRDRGIEQ